MRTGFEKDIPLTEAVERLNQQFTNVPPLTEEEVIAAVRTIKDKHPDIEEAVYRVYQRVATEKVLPKGMYFEHTDGWTKTRDGHFKNDRTDLTLYYSRAGIEVKNYDGFSFIIHDRNISFRPLAGWEMRKLQPLAEAEINKMRRLIEQNGAGQEHQPARLEESQTSSVTDSSNLGFNKEVKKDPPRTAAHDVLEAACTTAASESKVVFLKSGFREYPWCRIFEEYHRSSDVREILGKYYVIAAIDTKNMPDGEAVFSRYAEPGAPAWVIISPQKNVIVDSYSQAGNIGYPTKPEETAYYLAALRRATPAITDAELRTLSKQILAEHGPARSSETASPKVAQVITGGPVIGEPNGDRFPWPFALRLDRDNPLSVEGRVLDAAGRLLDKANVAITADVPNSAYTKIGPLALGQTVTDTNGGFRLTVPSIPPHQCWQLSAISRRNGYGINIQKLDPGVFRQQVTFVLQDERPVHCRVVDNQGQPVAGVQFLMSWGFTESWSETKFTRHYISFVAYPFVQPVAAWAPPATSDAEGRFVFHGIPRITAPKIDFILNVDDPRFAPQMCDVNVPHDDSEATLTLQPSCLVKGTVVCADTKAPMAGAWLKVAVVQWGTRGDQQCFGVETRTDHEGKFRVRCPRGKFLEVYVFPPAGAPYPMWVSNPEPWPADAKEHTTIVEVPRGVLVRGRVIEATSGVPVAGAGVEYMPKMSGEQDSRANGAFWAAEGRPVVTMEDGTFAFGVLPLPGHLLVKAPTPEFIGQVTSINKLQGREPNGRGNWYSVEGIAAINPERGSKEIQLTIPLRRGVTVRGTVVDPQGREANRALLITELNTRVHMLFNQSSFWMRQVRSGSFELAGCDPNKLRRVFFLDREKQWGATIVLDPKHTQPQPTVRLQPCGSATIRLLNAEGHPRVNELVWGGQARSLGRHAVGGRRGTGGQTPYAAARVRPVLVHDLGLG
jgi:protocatechuate 3,4-dioxygenase beta subunit